jgi:hypothetical protein
MGSDAGDRGIGNRGVCGHSLPPSGRTACWMRSEKLSILAWTSSGKNVEVHF